MQNKITNLRNHLFAQLERLNDEELSPEQLDAEIKRAQAISNVAREINASAKNEILFLKATGTKPGTDFFPDEDKPKQLNGHTI